MKKVCPVCSVKFIPNNDYQIYCCRAHKERQREKRRWRPTPVKYGNCVVCDKEFVLTRFTKKVCGPVCRKERENELQRRRMIPRPKPIISCDMCYRAFLKNAPRQKFCSRECFLEKRKMTLASADSIQKRREWRLRSGYKQQNKRRLIYRALKELGLI